jgi:isoleucyl-tRNA synthetase
MVGDMVRQFLLTLWNTYSFFMLYANVDGRQPPANAELLSGIELQLIDR